jgi:hypothetical protein
MPIPALAASSSTSANKIPCWKRLLNDWYDGTINKVYPQPCYSDAIRHLPGDLVQYSSAKDDIRAAQLAAAAHKPIPPEKQTTTTITTTTPNGKTTTTTETVPIQVVPAHKKARGITGILNRLTPGDPQAFPLPLVILGALAILLVAAGGAGMLWQRAHPRDGEPPPA